MKQLGRYELTRLIGQGGMGAVYEARDPRIGRRVVVKTFPLPSTQDVDGERLRQESEAGFAAMLNHPNIVAIYDAGEAENTAFIVMEYLTGGTLESLLSTTARSEWINLVPVLMPCARALDYAHSRGVVHGDVKPNNIMVDEHGTPKILDFGLARLAYHAPNIRSGTVMGTPYYLPPETVQGQPSGPASDQYSLAVIVYRMVTGAFPFVGSGAQLFYKSVRESPEPPDKLNSRLPAAVARAIERALSKNQADRFPTCAEFLSTVLSQLGPHPSTYALKDFTSDFESIIDSTSASARSPDLKRVLTPEFSAVEIGKQPRGSLNPLKRLFGTLTGLWSRSARKSKRSTTTLDSDWMPPEQDESLAGATLLQNVLDPNMVPDELARRQVAELIEFARQETFERVVALEGNWLPGIEGAEPPLLAFREGARYLLAAKNASSAHIAVEHLTRAEILMSSASAQLAQDRSPIARQLPEAFRIWTRLVRAKLEEARARLACELPNPFRAGQPLRPDQGRNVFRGRAEIVRRLESILTDGHSGSIALLGPRRCGKTSLLQMLPVLLPDCLCVFFDLQDNPVDSPQAFFEALYRQSSEQARRDRRIRLPALKNGGTFASAMEWFQALDKIEGDFRILLCLDEFERLEELFPGNRQDLLQLMGLFRATIQHRKKLRLLVSGVAPFDELGQIWNDHFINLRQVRVGHLDRSTALELLMQPESDFPSDAVPENVASHVFERTGGQPYLLQLYGSLLISHLNAKGNRHAVMEDIPPIEEDVKSQGAYYFRHAYEAAPAQARLALEELAVGQKPEIAQPTWQWLARRGLVAEDGRLLIPVLGTFMREELGLA
jgi:serine/threonine protein kinase